MSENVEKKRENGFWWVRWTDSVDASDKAAVVLVSNGQVFEVGEGHPTPLDIAERYAEFIAGPLQPPEAP